MPSSISPAVPMKRVLARGKHTPFTSATVPVWFGDAAATLASGCVCSRGLRVQSSRAMVYGEERAQQAIRPSLFCRRAPSGLARIHEGSCSNWIRRCQSCSQRLNSAWAGESLTTSGLCTTRPFAPPTHAGGTSPNVYRVRITALVFLIHCALTRQKREVWTSTGLMVQRCLAPLPDVCDNSPSPLDRP